MAFDLGALSSVDQGFNVAQTRNLQNQLTQEQVKQQQLATKQQQDAQLTEMSAGRTLAALAQGLGVAPPNTPPPQAPGQQSQPAPQNQPPSPQPQTQLPPSAVPVPVPVAPQGGPQIPQGANGQPVAPPGTPLPGPNGQPMAPPGTYMNPQGGGQPQAPRPLMPPQGPQAQPPRPAPPPQAGAPQGGPPPQQGQANPRAQGPIIPGQATVDQLTQRIIAANPGIQSRPDLIVKTLDRLQKVLAPDEKVLLDQQKLEMTYSMNIQKLDSAQQIALTKASSAQQVAEMKADFAEQKAQEAQNFAMQMAVFKGAQAAGAATTKDERASRQKAIDAITKSGGKVDPSATTEELQRQAGDATAAAADKKVGAVDRRGLINAATKVGVPIKAEMSDEEIQNATALKTAEAAGGSMPDTAKKFYGQALLAGDQALVNSALGMSKNRVGTMSQIIEGAQAIDPSFDGKKAAAAAAQYGGQKAAVTQLAKTGAGVELGAAEVAGNLPQALAAAKKLDLTKYPTVNALKNAAARGGLTTQQQQDALGQLEQYQQAIQSAYRQVISRGGRPTVFDAKQSEALMNSNLPVSVLLAKGDAMLKEADINRAAVKKTIDDVTSQNAAPDAANDPLGFR